MAVTYAPGQKTTTASTRLLVAAVFGVIITFVVGTLATWKIAPLFGWDGAALLYLGWIWTTIYRLDDKLTADFAAREDPSRATSDVTIIVASIASLGALGVVLVQAANSQGSARLWQVGLGVASVVVAWILVHTIFMLRYAELYDTTPVGGVEFDGSSQPSYADFAYLAFTMGMTFQVSDTGFKSTKFRTTALRHALLSYLFGTVIVATTINLVAGLSS
jgi:uncharacterized membrane protein